MNADCNLALPATTLAASLGELTADGTGEELNMTGARRVLVRQWELVRLLGAKHYGLTVRQLRDRTGASKQTLYRDLATLRDAGVPLVSSTSGGEARYRLMRNAELPALDLTALQIAALRLARAQLEPFAGAAFVAELDVLLSKLRPVEQQKAFQFAAAQASGHARTLKLIEQALQTKRRARIEYRSVSRRGSTEVVHVEPYFLRVADAEAYLRGWCVERAAERTYKLARIKAIALTEEKATHSPKSPPDEAFSRAIKAWSGEPTIVRIAIDREVAWLADEYPLVSDQRISKARNGDTVIEAQVAGIVETAKWVLSWGGVAEALEPPELRSMVRGELAKALNKYDAPGPAKTKARPEVRAATGRLTRGGTARA
jgi:predicted DNA-binding transcriptional regulator YafY